MPAKSLNWRGLRTYLRVPVIRTLELCSRPLRMRHVLRQQAPCRTLRGNRRALSQDPRLSVLLLRVARAVSAPASKRIRRWVRAEMKLNLSAACFTAHSGTRPNPIRQLLWRQRDPMNQPLGKADIENPNLDPVCHRDVRPDSRFTSLYRGHVFLFCCKQCKREFDQNPQLWVSVSHAEMVSSNHGVL